MATLTVNTNIGSLTPTLSNPFFYRYKKVVGGVFTVFTATSVSPFNVITSDPINTNYIFEIYKDCGGTISPTYTFQTNYSCTCGITSVANVVVGTCNSANNTHTLTFDVTYTCMKNDAGAITSVIKVTIGSQIYYINPTLQSGTQTVTISGLISDGTNKSFTVDCLPS